MLVQDSAGTCCCTDTGIPLAQVLVKVQVEVQVPILVQLPELVLKLVLELLQGLALELALELVSSSHSFIFLAIRYSCNFIEFENEFQIDMEAVINYHCRIKICKYWRGAKLKI